MDLSKRLGAIASLVRNRDIVADIGTDHGYIPIFLAQKNIAKKIYAMDVNKDPLEKAKQNAIAHKQSEKIECILSNGFENLPDTNVDTAIIAGMGGMLVSEILLAYPDKVKKLKQLILSPHQDVGEVRKTLKKLSFDIVYEKMLKEDGHYYTIISAVHQKISRNTLQPEVLMERLGSTCSMKYIEEYTEKELCYGYLLMESKSEVLAMYLEERIHKNVEVIEKLQKIQNENTKLRIGELQSTNKEMMEVITWIKK